MTRLTRYQKETLETFKNGSLIVRAARRSGKTFLLRYIAQHHKGSVGVLAPSYKTFHMLYGDLDNCRYNDLDASLILGDEVIYFAPRGKKSLSIVTATLPTKTWTIDHRSSLYGAIERMRQELSAEYFEHEFGEYLDE